MKNKNVKYLISAGFDPPDGSGMVTKFLGALDPKPLRSAYHTLGHITWSDTQDQGTRFDTHEQALHWLSWVFRKTKCVAASIMEAE